MSQIENIGVGQTELVISVIFQFFCRIVRETSIQSRESVELFKHEFAADAIRLAIKFLTINQNRTVSEFDEEEEKFTLSLAIVNFLKFISKDNVTKPMLNKIGRKELTLRKILFAE